MAKYLSCDGSILKIKEVKLTPGAIMQSLEGNSEAFELLSGDLLIFNPDMQNENHPRNPVAESFGNREFRGPVIFCEPEELD